MVTVRGWDRLAGIDCIGFKVLWESKASPRIGTESVAVRSTGFVLSSSQRCTYD